MPRISGVATKDAGTLLRLMYRFARRRYGAVPEPMTVAAHHQKLLIASGRHELAVQKASKALPANVRELAVYRVAQQLGCSWCVVFGAMLQRMEGLDIERLQQIDKYRTSPAYTHQERLAIAYADAMTASPVSVTDEQVAELRAEFGEKGVIELTYQIALENSRARFNSALDITDQGFTSGDLSAVVELLHPDAVLIGDSDGKAKTAARIMVGPDKIARFALGLIRQYGEDKLYAGVPVLINGDLGLLLPDIPSDGVHRALSRRVTMLSIRDGKIVAIYDIVNPDKLTRVPS